MISVYPCNVHFNFVIYYIIKINDVNKNRVTKIVKKLLAKIRMVCYNIRSKTGGKVMKKFIKILVLVFFIIVICFPKSMPNDVFWSIKTGDDLIHVGIKETDDWSIHTGLRTVAHHYLFDILIYIIYSLCSFKGLFIFTIILTLIITGLLYLLNMEICKSSKLSYYYLYLQIIMLRPFISTRAHWLSIIVFILEFMILEKITKKPTKMYYIILTVLPLVIMWIHMGVLPLYFIILGVYIVSNSLELKGQVVTSRNIIITRQLLIVMAIGIIEAFLNPYGIDGITYCTRTIFSDTIGNITEFQPLNIATNYIGLLVFGHALLIIIVLFVNKKIYLRDLLLILGTFFMSLVSMRYILYYTVFSSVILRYIKEINLELKDTDKFVLNVSVWSVIGCLIVFLIPNMLCSGDYVNKSEYPVDAYNSVKDYITEETRMFNDWNWGSYLALQGEKVFIDSRGDLYTEMYTKDVTILKDYLNIELNYKEVIKKYNINMFFVKANSPLSTILSIDNDFTPIYNDDVACVYVKK